MSFVIDTNILVAALNGHPGILTRLDELTPWQAVLCSPVLAELEFGAQRSTRRVENRAKIERLATAMRFEVFRDSSARKFGEIKAEAYRRGFIKSDFDLAIAAVALDLGAVLVSDDRAFHDHPIPGLEVQNWLRDPFQHP
jgi:tRNA(fMet)-specific endonuclease VapC